MTAMIGGEENIFYLPIMKLREELEELNFKEEKMIEMKIMKNLLKKYYQRDSSFYFIEYLNVIEIDF